MKDLPHGFRRKRIELHKNVGMERLKCLPRIIDDCSQTWKLDVMPPFNTLSYNYVAPAVGAAPFTWL